MIIVVGGSLGGCKALGEILRRLPATFATPVAVVLHRHRESRDLLAPALQEGCALAVCEAEDQMPLEAGRVYVCPADYHLLLDNGRLALSTDDLVNFARPAVDVLFESAAEWEGPAVIAVTLTGSGSDGAAGAKRVIAAGGTVLVQDPSTAEGPWMPAETIAATGTKHVLRLDQIADRLIELDRDLAATTAKAAIARDGKSSNQE